jgi:hypothetical protein
LLPSHRALSGGLLFTLPDTDLLVWPYNPNHEHASKFLLFLVGDVNSQLRVQADPALRLTCDSHPNVESGNGLVLDVKDSSREAKMNARVGRRLALSDNIRTPHYQSLES